MKKLVTFGEIMGRLAPAGQNRFMQSMPGDLEITFAGAEANVAVSYAWFGGPSAFLSALPGNLVGDAVMATLRRYNVATDLVLRTDGGRLGLYFVETGANQRPGRVIYDRGNSSINLIKPQAWDFQKAFIGAGWFHLTGITPALSRNTAEASILAVEMAREAGLTVSCDLNFRKKLWNWEPGKAARDLAEETMRQILPHVDVLIANEADAEDVLGIRAGHSETESGQLELSAYPEVARQIGEAFPNISRVAITLRESVSASHNNWSAMLYDTQSATAHFAPMVGGSLQPYEIRQIVDRVGAGDSFAAALIYALAVRYPDQLPEAIHFATAASCLAHSIRGDFNLNSVEEVEQLRAGNASGRVQR